MKIETASRSTSRVCLPGYPEVSMRFEWALTLTSLWILAGLYVDGWAHTNIPETIDSFFTPWHAVLYSGLAASIGVIGTTYLSNLRKGYTWLRSLPPVYMHSLLGAVIFVAAGNLDFIWHALFGFEEDVEALVSPSHLSLAVGGVLMISGPLRMAWERSRSQDNRIPWPALLSLFTVLGVFTFFTSFSNAFAHPNLVIGEVPAADTYLWDTTLISYVLIPSLLLMGFILIAILRWKLPPGSLTFLIAGSSLLLFVMSISYSGQYWQVLIAALLGGILADVLLNVLQPSRERVKALRWFSFLVPASLFLLYFLSLILTHGIWWNSNMWLGMIFFSGMTGLGLSWLTVPPYSPEESAQK
ncbi:MAG TPA: hypothetical protein VK880_09950 [Anaerolineales bacterium]|nr:hypothetical protein [Anaerolineales bacterium]